MKLTNILFLLTSLVTLTSAKDLWFEYDEDYYWFQGCYRTIFRGGATFCKGSARNQRRAKCVCKNENALASLIYCGYNYSDSKEKFNEHVADFCNSAIDDTSDEYFDQMYQYAVENIVDFTNDTSYNTSEIATTPVISDDLREGFYDTYIGSKHRYGNVKASHFIGIAFVAATVLVLIVSGIINWSMRLSKGFTNATDSAFTKKFRQYVNLGIFRNHLHPTILGFNPDAVETFWITIMFLYSLLSCCIMGFKYYPHDGVFHSYQIGTSRYWGDRSAILLSYQLPFLFLFPGRNNFFQYITRWKYSRFVTLHKWLGRIIMMEVLIHSFAMASQTYGLHNTTRIHTDWYIYGIVSTVAGCCACVVAIYSIRKYWYELFLVSHIVLVTMFLWTAWIHAESQDYQDFYWACCGIWVFDRFIRLVRIARNGIQTANAEYFPGDDAVLKLHVKKSSIFGKNIKPGSHAFISFLTKNTFWQSHPFTVFESVVDSNYITFCCRVKNGVTKKIANKFNNNNGEMEIKILVEGFYGEQSYYQQYDKSVFITGSTGIVGPFAHIKKLTTNNSNAQIDLFWGIRSYDSLKWFAPELLSLKNTNVVPKIYISQPEKISINSSNSSSTDSDQKSDVNENKPNFVQSDSKLQEVLEFVEIYHGRMPVGEIVDSELKDNTGSVAFGACAHTQVVDAVRVKVAKNLSSHDARIDYFEEMQNW